MKRVKLYSIAMLLILVVSAVVSPTLARAKAEISKEKATMEVDSLLTLRASGFLEPAPQPRIPQEQSNHKHT